MEDHFDCFIQASVGQFDISQICNYTGLTCSLRYFALKHSVTVLLKNSISEAYLKTVLHMQLYVYFICYVTLLYCTRCSKSVFLEL